MLTIAGNFRFFGTCVLASLAAIFLALGGIQTQGTCAHFSDFSVAMMNLL
jgi:hypothetical protein